MVRGVICNRRQIQNTPGRRSSQKVALESADQADKRSTADWVARRVGGVEHRGRAPSGRRAVHPEPRAICGGSVPRFHVVYPPVGAAASVQGAGQECSLDRSDVLEFSEKSVEVPDVVTLQRAAAKHACRLGYRP